MVGGLALALGALALPALMFVHGRSVIVRKTSAGEDNKVVEGKAERETERKVLVVVLGWGGAKLRQLRRLVEAYNQMGVDTLTYIAPMLAVIGGCIGTKAAEDICERIREKLHTHPHLEVYIHLHSNNGAFTYATFMHLWAKGEYLDVQSHIRGLLLDSTPAVRSEYFGSWKKYLIPFLFSAAVVPIILDRAAYFHPYWTPACIVTLPLLCRQPVSHEISLTAAIQYLHSGLNPSVPQLYLYSTKDVLIPHKKVEAFMQSEQSKGKSVHSHCWHDTAHVSHYRVHPRDYMQAVTEFMAMPMPAVLG